MSRYDIIKKRFDKLRLINLIITLVPSALIIGIIIWKTNKMIQPIWICMLSLASLLILPHVFQFIFKISILRYVELIKEICRIQSETKRLIDSVNKIYASYQYRNKGEQFKRAYELIGKSIRECEETLAVGMSRENKEVFVTCFMKAEKVVKVTASIGSAFHCSPSDNPIKWKDQMERLGCDGLRQYHNHLGNNNKTCPSPGDLRCSKMIKQILGNYKGKFQSFIIFWNRIREWRILEFDERGKSWVAYEFDVSAHKLECSVL